MSDRTLSDEWIGKALGYVSGLLLAEEGHRHHRLCVHNLSAEEQKAAWRRRAPDPEMYDLIYGDTEPVVITPDEWEIDAPDFGPMFNEGADDE